MLWSVTGIHNSDSFYKDPKTFDPHRYDGKESNTLQDEHWFGFGAGPRACPAVRWAFIAMKIMMVQLLKDYKVVRTDKTVEIDEWTMHMAETTIQPDKPFLVGFEKRA